MQEGILAKAFVWMTSGIYRENIENIESTSNGYIYSFSLLCIALLDITTYYI